jgi:hypothetical protein
MFSLCHKEGAIIGMCTINSELYSQLLSTSGYTTSYKLYVLIEEKVCD